MLKEILKELYTSRTYSKFSIGKSLNISENMVEDMVFQLIRMGYVEEDMGSPTCESKCRGCTVSNCNVTPIRMLSVTEKGKKVLNK